MNNLSLKMLLIILGVLFLVHIQFFQEIPNVDYEIDKEIVIPSLQMARLPFIENQGQMSGEVKFYTKTFTGTVYVTDSDLTYYSIKIENDSTKALVIKEKFLGNTLQPLSGSKSKSVVNYFKGDQQNWRTNIPTYDDISLGEVWNKIDIKLQAYNNNVEKIFLIRPSGTPSDIQVSFDGVNNIEILNDRLVVNTDLGSLALSKPIAYQVINGKRHDVQVSYNIIDSVTYGFSVLSYDPRFDLIIDPLIASTFIGGSASEFEADIAIDGTNVYITGRTFSSDFPTTAGAYDVTKDGGTDVYVSKFNNALTSLLASTFIGGSAGELARDISTDGTNVYITGFTSSSDFPTTAGAYDTALSGLQDVFLSKLSGDLTMLSASTYFGGSGNDDAYAILFDGLDVYITGWTTDAATDLPTTAGAYDEIHNGGNDAFVSIFDDALTTLIASTFLGGSGLDEGRAITTDGLDVYVTGRTTSAGFPTPIGFDTTHNGGDDVFVSKLDLDLTTLSASTFLGGSSTDRGFAIKLDSANNVYITGSTIDDATDLPFTVGAYDTTHNGGTDAFVSKFNDALTSLEASTFIGGSGTESGEGLTIDSSDNIYIVGHTADDVTDFPTTAGAYDVTHDGGGDVFVSKFSNTLATLSSSTLIGVSSDDVGLDITHDSSHNIYVTGYTTDAATDFPTTPNAYDITHNGLEDIFVSILDGDLSGSGSATLATGGSVSITLGEGGTATVNIPSGDIVRVTLPAGTKGTVTVADSNAGDSDVDIKFLASIVNINGPCSAGCTIQFTFTDSDLSSAGLSSPTDVKLYHDSNEDGNFEESEALTTIVNPTTPPGPYTATATVPFTSKFAVGGVKALAIAAQVLGSIGEPKGCDPDGFSSGISLRVYSISYDKCETNKMDIIAYSTCGPINAEVVSDYGTKLAVISDHQPHFKDPQKKVIYSAGLDPEIDSVNVIVKDQRDSFVEKIYLNQCTATKSYTFTTGYTSEQHGPLVGNNTQPNATESQITPTGLMQKQDEPAIPSWIKINAAWWSSGQIDDDAFTQGIEYLIKHDIIRVSESAKTETPESSKQIPSWIKTNSQWWADGMISDSEFTKGLEYLIKVGVIRV